MSFIFRVSFFAMVLLACSTEAFGCTVPVFRYALERWNLSTYDLYVFHSGPLDASLRDKLRLVERAGGNWRLHAVDLRQRLEPALEKLWKKFGQPQRGEPWALLQLAEPNTDPVVLWKGTLNEEALEGVLQSPLQLEIHEQLARGITGVFVLLESGNDVKDRDAWAMIREHLPRFEKQIKLPVQTGEGPELKLPLPLEVRFHSVRLPKEAGKNAWFRHHLLATEDGLAHRDEPILFIVFGRGRLLGSLYGEELNPDHLFRAASFLCGECSCEVKELNPGIDLLFNVDWTHRLSQISISPQPLPPREPTQKSVEMESVLENVSHVDSPASPSSREGEPDRILIRSDYPQIGWLPWATALAGGCVVATGVWAFRSRGRVAERT